MIVGTGRGNGKGAHRVWGKASVLVTAQNPAQATTAASHTSSTAAALAKPMVATPKSAVAPQVLPTDPKHPKHSALVLLSNIAFTAAPRPLLKTKSPIFTPLVPTQSPKVS